MEVADMQSTGDGSTKFLKTRYDSFADHKSFAHATKSGFVNKSIIDELTRTPIVEGTDFQIRMDVLTT